MARSKIPVVDNSLTTDEQEFIAGGASDNKASNGAQRVRWVQADWRSTRSGVGILQGTPSIHVSRNPEFLES